MKLLLLNLFLFSLISFASFAQNSYSAKGSVVDTTTGVKLTNASVSVIRAKDSILVKFTRTTDNGTFELTNLPKGKMFMLFTYPGYADYVEHFNLDSSKTSVNFGRVKLILKANLLNDVIIKGKAVAIKIKGDTTEFNAAAYKIQPNDKVEDLLKQLQGVQVDKDGKITAQGSKVNKVLVDGEEFFGDDPTLVTKNIRADMVDKVQLYDKKSDQAAFTGIDDGEKAKTINIKLKEDKKNGYFGKLDLGGATDDFYQAQGMFNLFKGKQKFSAYGTLANTGKTGLGWGDSEKYGSSSLQMVDGGFYFSGEGNGLDSYNGQYNNEGIPIARTGGAHYENKWNSDKESINANYKIGSLTVDGVRNTLTQNNQPNGLINSNSDESFHNYLFRQKADATYNLKLDTTANLKLNADGTLKNSQNNSDYSTESRRGDGSLLNTSERSLTNNLRNQSLNGSVFLTKKLKKKGRTISVTLSEALTNTETKGYLKSDNEFYNAAGTLDSAVIVDQYKTSLVKTSLFNSMLAYTEPITKKLSLVLNYGLALNNSTSDRKSFNKTADDQYTDLDRIFSNNYKLNQVSNQGGAIFNYINNKSTVNFGTKVTNVRFKQENLYDNSTFNRTFINWNPQFNYRYKFSQQKSTAFYYSGYNTQPTITQIQPILVNTDPLNLTLGNPDLKPSFTHNFSVNYNSYKMLSGQSIYAYASYSLTANPIVNNTETDSAGKSTYQSVNLTSKKATSMYMYLSADRKINFVDMNVGLNAGMSGNSSFNYVNGSLNESKSKSYNGSLSLSKYKEKKFSGRVSGGPTYTTNQSSLQQQINDNGWGFNGDAYFNVYLPAKFEIGGDGTYEYRAATKSFNTDFSRTIINARITRSFLKSDALKFGISVNDLLNKNVGFSRNAYGNMITQNSYTTIKRYFMATVSWDFNKMGGAAPKK
jgi:hypothetical protein